MTNDRENKYVCTHWLIEPLLGMSDVWQLARQFIQFVYST